MYLKINREHSIHSGNVNSKAVLFIKNLLVAALFIICCVNKSHGYEKRKGGLHVTSAANSKFLQRNLSQLPLHTM